MARIRKEDRQKFLDQTRLQLLEAASQEFAKAGYSQANINTISISAGFAKGTVYNYFPSKQSLFLALIDATALEHFQFIVERVRPDPDPVHRVIRFYQAGFDFIPHRPTQARVLFNTVNSPDEQLKAHVFEVYQPMFRFVAEEILAVGYEQGIFHAMEFDSAAMLLMTIYLGTASQLGPNGRPWLDPDQVSALVLNGLVKGKERDHDHHPG
jgi:AcrR family transcriptional regulator